MRISDWSSDVCSSDLLWLAFFIVASLSGLYQLVVLHDSEIFSRIVLSLFDMAERSVELMILLFGTLTLWLGFLRIAEAAGLVDLLGRWLTPLFRRLMPGTGGASCTGADHLELCRQRPGSGQCRNAHR